MTGNATIIFIDSDKHTFGDKDYKKYTIVDNEGVTDYIYIPVSVSLKFGDKIIVSARYNDKHTFKFKWLKDE